MNLQPLRIEAGWCVNYNQLYEVDPISGYEIYFEGSSLLMLENKPRLKLIDIQWRPERDLNGEYKLQVLNFVENHNPKTNEFDNEVNWEMPFLTFTTKSRLELVEKLEELMRVLPNYEDPRITINRGVVDEISEFYRINLIENGLSKELIKKVLENGNSKIQNIILDDDKVTREIILQFEQNGISKKVRNKATQKLNSKQFKE
jgi:hypothetical protein